MGFEYKAGMRAAAGAKAPPSLEENYRRWLRCMRDRITLELAGEAMAAEWLIRRADETPEECRLQTLKAFVLDSMLREAEAKAVVRPITREEQEDERRRWRKYLAATVVMLSLCAVFLVCAFRIPSGGTSLSEFLQFMCFQAAMIALVGGFTSALYLLPQFSSDRSDCWSDDGYKNAMSPRP